MEESETISNDVLSLTTLLPDPVNPPKRADLLSLKLRLASVLSPEAGQLYWNTLIDFITGKINRQELGNVMNLVLGIQGEAVQIHNALLLSILYNTTRPSLPPASLRHSGWHKRRRDKDGTKLEDIDPKRRKIKAHVMALGKRERAEIKSLAIVRKENEKAADASKAHKALLRDSMDSKGAKLSKEGLPINLKSTETSTTLEQEYARCLQVPLCCESKMLPDVDNLKDRMSLISYDLGLSEGADSKVAALGLLAIDIHLKAMITSVISLVRSNRANGIRTTTQSSQVISSSSSSSIPNPLTTNSLNSTSSRPKILISNGSTTVPLESLNESPESMSPVPILSTSEESDDYFLDSPLTTSDFSALFEISPHLLVQQHLGVIERLYAIPSTLSDSSSEDESSSDEEVVDVGKNASKSLSRSNSKSSRSARSNSNGNGNGREQYLIDPSAIAIPLGHPDVTHTHPTIGSLSLPSPHLSSTNSIHPSTNNPTPSIRLISRKPSMNSYSLKNGNGAGGSQSNSTPTVTNNNSRSLSPTSANLRFQLFPELEGGNSSDVTNPSTTSNNNNHKPNSINHNSRLGITQPQSPNYTSSDGGGSDSEVEEVKIVEGTISGLGRNAIRTTSTSGLPTSTITLNGGTLQNGSNSNGTSSGRKLWEVVNSHRLLEGVLERE